MGTAGAALGPDQLVLVVNRNVPEGLRIARYYMDKRHVPLENLITVETSREESLGREAYDSEIAAPVRTFLLKNDPGRNRFACLVLLYGIPLRVGPLRLSPADKVSVRQLRAQLSVMEKKKAGAGSREEVKSLDKDIERVETEIARLARSTGGASVDSEMALVMEEKYPLEGYSLAESYTAANPFWSWQMVLIGDPLYRPFKTGN